MPIDQLISAKYPGWLMRASKRFGAVRGLLLFFLGRSYDLIVTEAHARGSGSLLLLEALFGGKCRRIVLLEFIRPRRSGRRGPVRLLYPLWFSLIAKPTLQRALRVGQVLTKWESEHYAEIYGLPEDTFKFIPWPLGKHRHDGLPAYAPDQPEAMIVSSGRAACDWETLFRAVEGQGWHLTVVCGRRDLQEVERLNIERCARVLCEIPQAEHERIIHEATVYVLCLKEDLISSGQIRMSNAIQAGIPIIATRVAGLEGYALDGETAVMVNAGDHAMLRTAIRDLIESPETRLQLRERAFVHASQWTMDDYLMGLRTLVSDALERQ